MEPLSGEAVWFADGIGPDDAGLEETLVRFRCAAVFLPARRISAASSGWTGGDLAAPARPLSRVPVVLVIESAADPLEGVPEERRKSFGGYLAAEITAALSRGTAFGQIRGVHLDVPFSAATAEAHAAALREARSILSHGLSRGKDARSRLAREVPVTLSMRRPPPSDEKEQETVRALASRTDGIVAFVFGGDNDADAVFVDSLGKRWWAGFEPAAAGAVRKSSGESGPSVPEGVLDALTDDPRIELRHELPWNEERGWEFALRASRDLAAAGLTLSAGDSVVFSQPSLADFLARFRSETARRRFARGRVVVFRGGSESERLFPVSALEDVLAGGRTAPMLRVWAAPEGSRLLRVGAENLSPHASVVSRVENWIEVDLAPARVSDVEPGGFDRWEAYDEKGRAVSPGRASRVRFYETLVAPLERFEPARLKVRGTLPSPCCRMQSHVAAAAGGETRTDWALPEVPTP